MPPSWAAAMRIFRLIGFSGLKGSVPRGKLRHLGNLLPERFQRRRSLPRQEAPAAALGGELAVVDDDFAARHYRDRPAGEFTAFVRRVAGVVVDEVLRDGHALFGIPERDVGVGPD